MKHHKTFLPPSVYGALRAAAAAKKTRGINGAARLIFAGMDGENELTLRAVRGLPAIEPFLKEAWIQTPLKLPAEMVERLKAAAATSGLQIMFIAGVILVSVSTGNEFEARIEAQKSKERGIINGEKEQSRVVAAAAR